VFTADSSEEFAVAIVRSSNNKIQRTGAAIHCIRTILLPAADPEPSTDAMARLGYPQLKKKVDFTLSAE
jgi:hypothetical protein